MDLPLSVIENRLCRGCFLHSDDIFEYIDHGKVFVIIGEDENNYVGFFFINSNINSFITKKPSLFALQYMLYKKDYPCLDYDSYLCCTEIKKLEKTKLAQSITEGRTKIITQLNNSHIEKILEIVRKSKLFTSQGKNTFFK